MKSILRVAFTWMAALVCSCVVVQPIESLNSRQISEKTTVAHDDSKKVTQVQGLKLVFGEFQENHYRLSAHRVERDPVIHYALFMQTLRKSALGGMGWKAATDEHRQQFGLLKETKQRNEDTLFESVTFEMTRDWLERAVTHEVKVRIGGAITNQILVLPTNYVSGFLRRVDETFAPQQSATISR